ncbi:MAG: PIG-L family deacetylase [Rhodocyclaceae bacterium]|nr:PIG-L family deacetylase [Rhodocyclaceae bacterium]
MRYKAVVISPHLDDAVFSCGAAIARHVADGPVLVLNVFTEFPETVKSHAVVLGPERYEEERRAAQCLGFESRNLGEVDAACRRPEYRSLGNIFRPPVESDTGAYLVRLRQTIFDMLAAIDFDVLYVPLGIGWHVDHVLVFRIFEPWIGKDFIRHYEDVPYSLIPSATRCRLNELGQLEATEDDRTLTDPGFLRSWMETTRGYAGTALMKNLKPAPVRWAAVPVTGVYFFELMWRHRQLAKKHGRHVMCPTTEDISPLLGKKLDAMSCYESQFREFFADSADCEGMFAAYAAQSGLSGARAIERYWRLKA